MEGFVKKTFLTTGAECKFKKGKKGKVRIYKPEMIKGIFVEGRYFESIEYTKQDVVKNRKREVSSYYFMERIVDSQVDLLERKLPRTRKKEYYIKKGERLVQIKYKGKNEMNKTLPQ